MDICSLRTLYFCKINYHICLECSVPLLMHGIILFITRIVSYNPITLIFTDNKLTKPNYVDWKRNLNIVLITKQLNR